MQFLKDAVQTVIIISSWGINKNTTSSANNNPYIQRITN